MKYGIIVCPNCKFAKITELSHQTTKCIKCNKTLSIHKLKIFCKGSSIISLRHELGLLNKNLDNK